MITNALSIQNLTKKYGDLLAVDHILFDIHRNEIFGLLGPNGAGKTTAISMICGLLPVTEGSIEYEGFGGKAPKSLIGYCPQENIYYPKLTCFEQLIFMGQLYGLSFEATRKNAIQLLGYLGLEDKTHVMASALSGGMKRRLNICLALIHNPEVLILDEPESGLDPQSRILVRDFIRNFGNEKTIILTTHNMDEADRLADRIAIIDYGRLLLLDTPSNLKKTIGEGDTLEIGFEGQHKESVNYFSEELTRHGLKIKVSGERIFINSPDLIELIPEIRSKAQEKNLMISEMKLRENTLEDVFIHLTGRSLRQ